MEHIMWEIDLRKIYCCYNTRLKFWYTTKSFRTCRNKWFCDWQLGNQHYNGVQTEDY